MPGMGWQVLGLDLNRSESRRDWTARRRRRILHVRRRRISTAPLLERLPLRRCGSIKIDESHQLFCHIGEQLEFSGVQRLAQQLQQEDVRAVGKTRSQAAEEKPETAGGV